MEWMSDLGAILTVMMTYAATAVGVMYVDARRKKRRVSPRRMRWLLTGR